MLHGFPLASDSKPQRLAAAAVAAGGGGGGVNDAAQVGKQKQELEPQAQLHLPPEPQAQPQASPEPQAQPQASSQPEAEPHALPGLQLSAQPQPEPQSQTQLESMRLSQPQPLAQGQRQPLPQAQPQPQALAQPQPQALAQAQPPPPIECESLFQAVIPVLQIPVNVLLTTAGIQGADRKSMRAACKAWRTQIPPSTVDFVIHHPRGHRADYTKGGNSRFVRLGGRERLSLEGHRSFMPGPEQPPGEGVLSDADMRLLCKLPTLWPRMHSMHIVCDQSMGWSPQQAELEDDYQKRVLETLSHWRHITNAITPCIAPVVLTLVNHCSSLAELQLQRLRFDESKVNHAMVKVNHAEVNHATVKVNNFGTNQHAVGASSTMEPLPEREREITLPLPEPERKCYNYYSWNGHHMRACLSALAGCGTLRTLSCTLFPNTACTAQLAALTQLHALNLEFDMGAAAEGLLGSQGAATHHELDRLNQAVHCLTQLTRLELKFRGTLGDVPRIISKSDSLPPLKFNIDLASLLSLTVSAQGCRVAGGLDSRPQGTCTHLTSLCMDDFTYAPKLKQEGTVIPNFERDFSDSPCFSSYTALRSLDGPPIDFMSVVPLSRLPRLTHLRVASPWPNFKRIPCLLLRPPVMAKLEALEELVIRDTACVVMVPLHEVMPALKRLQVADLLPPNGDAAQNWTITTSSLTHNPSITHLQLPHDLLCRVGPIPHSISSMSTLTHLYVRFPDLRSYFGAGAPLQPTPPKLPHLLTLVVSGYDMAGPELDFLCDMLMPGQCPWLQEVCVLGRSWAVHRQQVGRLCSRLCGMPFVHTLWLDACLVCPRGGVYGHTYVGTRGEHGGVRGENGGVRGEKQEGKPEGQMQNGGNSGGVFPNMSALVSGLNARPCALKHLQLLGCEFDAVGLEAVYSVHPDPHVLLVREELKRLRGEQELEYEVGLGGEYKGPFRNDELKGSGNMRNAVHTAG